MIDVIDPNLNQPQPPASPAVEPVEPIKPNTAGIEGGKLDDREKQRLVDEERQRRRRRDTVELSGQEMDEDDTEEGGEPSPGEDKDQGSGAIDIII